MSEGNGLKSRMDLLMERLKNEDAEGGGVRALTDEERTKIAEIRNVYAAKLAEAEILNQGKLNSLWEPEARELLLDELRQDRERLARELDAKIEKVRTSGA
jgi:hypothetical protein